MVEFRFRYLISFSPDDLSAMRTCFMFHLLVLLLVLVVVLVLLQLVLTTTLQCAYAAYIRHSSDKAAEMFSPSLRVLCW